MPNTEDTIATIVNAPTWDVRVARIRQIPAQYGTNAQTHIYAEIARQSYVPHLSPEYAYIPVREFFELPHFQAAYEAVIEHTSGFTRVSVADLAAAIQAQPFVLLPLRVITGLLKDEFAGSTKIVGQELGLEPLSSSKVDSMERSSTRTSEEQALVAAETLDRIMNGTLYREPPKDWKVKQQKPDTDRRWETVRQYATSGVPYSVFLNQRHYGGAFRQVLDSTSEVRGKIIEDAVEALFDDNGIRYIQTGSTNQGEIATRFEVTVQPAPDFVVYDETETLRAFLECKGTNNGGTARDKANRFERLREESIRLGGVPLIAVVGGLGWTRVNDTLGPVVRYCDGRVFSVSNLDEMLSVSPFPALTSQR